MVLGILFFLTLYLSCFPDNSEAWRKNHYSSAELQSYNEKTRPLQDLDSVASAFDDFNPNHGTGPQHAWRAAMQKIEDRPLGALYSFMQRLQISGQAADRVAPSIFSNVNSEHITAPEHTWHAASPEHTWHAARSMQRHRLHDHTAGDTKIPSTPFWLGAHKVIFFSATGLLICYVLYVVVMLIRACLGERAQEDDKQIMISPRLPKQSILTVTIVVGGGFVATEVGRTLLTFHSLGSSSQHLAYEPSAVVFISEIFKLVVATGYILADPRGTTWQESQRVFWPQGGVAFLYAAQNTLNIYAVLFVGPALFALLGQSKIFFTCLFMWLMLGKKFSINQQVAVVLLVVAVALPEFSDKKPPSSSADGFLLLVGVALVLFASVCSALSAVLNEQMLKNETLKAPFMVKNAMLYLWGVGLNFLAMVCKPNCKWFQDFGLEALLVALLLVGIGLSIAWILKYMDNVVRCFASVTQVFLTTNCSVILFGDSLDMWSVSGTGIFACAIILYSYKPGMDFKTLKWQILFSIGMVLMTFSLWSFQSCCGSDGARSCGPLKSSG